MNKVIAAVVVIVILAAGGWVWHDHKNSTNNSASTGSTNTTNSQSNNSSSSSSRLAAEGKISIQNMMFTPSQITIQKGGTVTWTNNDSVAHTVTSDDGTSFDSGTVDPGKTYSHTFNAAGSFQYHCTIHSSMRGTIVVK